MELPVSIELPRRMVGLQSRRNVYAIRSCHIFASERESSLSNCRSRTWPEPEAISTLAEGVWAPKEHNPLPTPDKSLDQSPDHACSDSEHTESSIDEKLGLQRGHDSSSDGRLKSRFLGSRLGRSVNSLVEQGVGAGKRAWGRIFTGSAETGGLHGLELKLVHLAAVGVHLAVAVWALGFDPSWLPGGKTTDESTGWLRKSALVRRYVSVREVALLLVGPVPFCLVDLK